MDGFVSRVRAGVSRFFSPRNFAAIAAVPALVASAHLASYTVRPGDTLSGIAQSQCGSAADYPALAAASGIADPADIYVGQRVTLDCDRAAGGPAAPAAGSGDPSGDLTRSQVGQLWLGAGGPAWAEWDAEQIAWCESGWNTRAYNPSGASGLWQILGQVSPGWIFDARVNAQNAVGKFRGAGDSFAPWVCQA